MQKLHWNSPLRRFKEKSTVVYIVLLYSRCSFHLIGFPWYIQTVPLNFATSKEHSKPIKPNSIACLANPLGLCCVQCILFLFYVVNVCSSCSWKYISIAHRRFCRKDKLGCEMIWRMAGNKMKKIEFIWKSCGCA